MRISSPQVLQKRQATRVAATILSVVILRSSPWLLTVRQASWPISFGVKLTGFLRFLFEDGAASESLLLLPPRYGARGMRRPQSDARACCISAQAAGQQAQVQSLCGCGAMHG
eukprot:6489153-Amphidinium_carterae.1